MERRTVARALRAIRGRKGWTQRQLGARLGISRSEVSRWEASDLDRCSVEEVERWATALNGHLSLELRVDGERPLVYARHAAIQNWLAGILRADGWIVEVEVSFNVFGDRGRIDVLAYHAMTGALVVIEIKTRIDDAQDVLGRLDVKKRIAPTIARDRDWRVVGITPALFVLDGSTARRRIGAHAALFAPFALRARAAMAWLRRPKSPMPTGILAFVTPPRRDPH
jgi:transcriptional regulator with XRE-family HTH domain